MSKIESLRSARFAFRLPRFILLRSFSDTLFVVSILGIVNCRWFCSPEGVKRMRDSNCSVIIENESFIKLVAATGIAN